MKRQIRLSLALSAISMFLGVLQAQPDPQMPHSSAGETQIETITLNLDTDESTGPQQPARAYRIAAESQFVPGHLGDAFLGDVALENGSLRAVIGRADKPPQGAVRGGTLMDVTLGADGIDYLGGINTSVQPETTGSIAVFTSVEPLTDTGGLSATVVMEGFIGDPGLPPPDADQLIKVKTEISAVRGSATLDLITTFTNATTRTAWIMPADVADWGEMSAFSEGAGYNTTTGTTQFAMAGRDNFSLGYYTAGANPIHGLQAGRQSILLAHAGSVDPDLFQASYQSVSSTSGDSIPADLALTGGTVRPAPGYVIFPGTEQRYIGGPNGLPVSQPIYIPKVRLKYVDGQPTVSLTLGGVSQLFEQPDQPDRYVKLDGGAEYVFRRYIRVGNADWAPAARDAYCERGVQVGLLGGAVVEARSGKRIAGATVRVSGGANWNGEGAAPAVMQTKSRPDGSFAVRVPPGKYRLVAEATGRRQAQAGETVTVTANGKPAISVVQMTREALIRMAISEAETATSSPLPVKVTIISKPPYSTEDYGFSPSVENGIRNVRYLPQGAAVFPLSPGRYRLVISRGIEYDTLEKDIALSPGQELTVTGALPHVTKPYMPAMASMDAGVLTNASGAGYATAETRAIQAACEGVQVLVSGDYGQVTNLQAAIQKHGLQRWVKAFSGRRILLSKDDLSADLFVYPLDEQSSATLDKALSDLAELPPDVAIADLKKLLPNLIFEISRPMHPEVGYLNAFDFDAASRSFSDGNLPPPDFNAIQLVEGKKQGLELQAYPRYMSLQTQRLQIGSVGKAPPLSPTGSSNSRLPYGEEVGYLRTYIYLNSEKAPAQITESDIVSAIRGQHFMVTNGPILLLDSLDYKSGRFDVRPGDIVDLKTTDVLRLRAKVIAAPWVGLNGLSVRENGSVGVVIQNIEQTERLVRYPTHGESSGDNVFTRYLKQDTVLDALAYGTFKDLEPVVPNPMKDFGGQLFPMAWCGPIFVDRNGDGKITLPQKEQ